MIVVDCSIAMAWHLPDEVDAANLGIYERVVREGAVVPAHWPLEIGSVLTSNLRRGRIDRPFLAAVLENLRRLPITVEPGSRERTWGAVIELAAAHGLTVYDAAYLELARRRRLPLATLDRELAAAATAAGTPVLPVAEPTPPSPRPRRGKRA